MTFGGIKTYHLIYLDFSTREYFIFEYRKDRRFTARQAWLFIRNNTPVSNGKLKPGDTIEKYFYIVDENGFNLKHCDRYMTFMGFK